MLVVHEHVLTKGGKIFSLLFRLTLAHYQFLCLSRQLYFSLRAESPNLGHVPLIWPFFSSLIQILSLYKTTVIKGGKLPATCITFPVPSIGSLHIQILWRSLLTHSRCTRNESNDPAQFRTYFMTYELTTSSL